MEEFYRFHSPISCSDDISGVGSTTASINGNGLEYSNPVIHDTDQFRFRSVADHAEVSGSEMSDLIKAQIASHPLYPELVSAYVQCRKVGAPPEMASLLEEIGKERHPIRARSQLGADPELDDFMESYCEVLHRYKEELSKPFNEATTFLSDIEAQFSSLCRDTLTTAKATSLSSGTYHSVAFEHERDNPEMHVTAQDTTTPHTVTYTANEYWVFNFFTPFFPSDEAPATSEEDLSCVELETVEGQESSSACQADQDLKEMLLRKYSGYLSSLKKDFLKTRKKGKLPKDARLALLDWWNIHYRWPYPTVISRTQL
ncbi:hypothetical protein RJ639_036888 [Escallonia herrerae]|uniref:ELK domain-containing protein n=1 Tax=Escallonia herrerae TaxID=1293975 RepID=A0AA88WPF1_9ASTE|nr:hypothetical protein RJ639_036888 [Escallonia herrerae]